MPEFDSIINDIQQKIGFYTASRSNERRFTNAVLLFAFNGTGKTRLSYEFAHRNRKESQHHTLYYNAFTEDLFTWHNDLDSNTERYMVINTDSALIRGLEGYNYDDGINNLLCTLVGFKAHFETHKRNEKGEAETSGDSIPREVWFSRPDAEGNDINYIKISRGEERLFVWCVFRYIVDLVVGGDPNFRSIRYIYIDDPMSSLDDNNIILFASQLAGVINKCYDNIVNHWHAHDEEDDLGLPYFIISTHHGVFYNTMRNALIDKNRGPHYFGYLLTRDASRRLTYTYFGKPTPIFYHLSMFDQFKKELDIFDSIQQQADPSDTQVCHLQRHHFNVMRGIVEQLAQFCGESGFGHVLDGIAYHFNGQEFKADDADNDSFNRLHDMALNAMSHTSNTMFEVSMLNNDNIQILRDIYTHIVKKFNLDSRYILELERNNNQ